MNKVFKQLSLLFTFCILFLPVFADSDDDFTPGEAPGVFVFSLILAGVGWLIEQVKYVTGLGVVLKFIGLFGAAATIILFILHYVAILVDGLLRVAFYIAIVGCIIWLVVQAYNWLAGKSKNDA